MSLLGIFKFCTLLPILVNNLRSADDDVERQFYLKEFLATSQPIFVELDHLKTSIIKRFWPKVPQFFTPYMLHYLKYVQRALDLKHLNSTEQNHLYKLQVFCNKLSRISEAPKAHLDLIQAYLKQDELSEIKTQELLAEFESEKKEKTGKAKAATKSKKTVDISKAASVAPLSLFCTPSLPPQYIPISDIPQCLLHLAKQIKARFSTNLILVGGALTNLFLKRPNPNDYDCLVFNLNLTELYDFLISSGYTNSIIIGKQYPIIKVKIETDGKILELDLTTVNTSPYANLHDSMAEILCKRDFKLCALYLDLIASGPHFEIKGFDHAIHSINQKRISFVHDPKRSSADTIFTEDPLRTFRLIKILLQYPDFSPDSHLQHTLKTTSFKKLFADFMAVDLNQSRIGTNLEILFKRFNLEDVINKLGTLGILEGFTGLSFKKIQGYLVHFYTYISSKIPQAPTSSSFACGVYSSEAIENLISYTKKLAFFQFLCMCYCIENPDKELSSWVAHGLIKKVKISDQAYSVIHQAVNQKRPEILVDPSLIELLTQISVHYESIQFPVTQVTLKA
jgi:tRNA nucleotidyltransferase/poly(A) polymerase